MKDRLKAARNRAKLSQVDLADRCGLTQAAISDLETGKSSTTAFAPQIAAVLGVSALWLVSGEGAMDAVGVSIPTPKPQAIDAAIIRANAYLDCAVSASEQALQAALVGAPGSARKIRSALALLRDARVQLGIEATERV